MPDRKQTPDILTEILGGGAPAAELDFAPPPRQPAKAVPKTPKTVAAPRPARAQPAAPSAWQYRIASFQEHNGWRLRYIDGQSVANWPDGLSLPEYLALLGEQGWELVAAAQGAPLWGHGDRYQLYFKRPA